MDDVKNSSGPGDVSINMDESDRQRYQQQLQLIDEQVNLSFFLTILK
jgi:hypothetical protein